MTLQIIPKPQKVEQRDGVFILDKEVVVSGDISENIELQLKNMLLPTIGATIVKVADYEPNGICFASDDSINEEGYNLIIKEDGITIKASTDKGYFYAIVTLSQLLSSSGRELPLVNIQDYPRFNYRGFMLDVGRYFYSVQDVIKFIDMMALLKLNKLHIHLTEDQGWRIQIDKYPLLTEQGSKRSHTNFNCTPHGGYYTKSDIKQIVDYAHANYIEVIPEIDMPGHTQAAISCYRDLSCFDRKLDVATHFGVKHDILCAGKDSTYEFVKNVLTEVIEMFPDGVIHLGGDEAVKVRWNICPNCKAKMNELKINADELQSVFMEEISNFVKEKGYKVVIWNETKKDEIMSDDIIWEYYMAEDNIERLMISEVNSGRKIINACSNAYYYDLPYHDVPLKNAYNYEPVVPGFKNPENVLGVEANLWTEYVKDMKVAVKKLFPRAFAMAETAWLNEDKKDYDDFVTRVDNLNKIIKGITGLKPTSVKKANPNAISGFFEKCWFERRQLHWQGIHIPLDDLKVKMKYTKK